MARIEQRNQELLRLKMTTGRTVQVLNTLKVRRRAVRAPPPRTPTRAAAENAARPAHRGGVAARRDREPQEAAQEGARSARGAPRRARRLTAGGGAQNQGENARVAAEIKELDRTMAVLQEQEEERQGLPEVMDYVKQNFCYT